MDDVVLRKPCQRFALGGLLWRCGGRLGPSQFVSAPFLIAQQVSPRVTHMCQRVGLPTQYQRGERGQAQHRVAALVDAAKPGILGRDDTVQRHRGVPGFGRAVVITHQTGHCGLRRLFAHATGADAIGDCSNCSPAFLRPVLGQHGGAKVFIVGFSTRHACKTDVNFKCHAPAYAIAMPERARRKGTQALFWCIAT